MPLEFSALDSHFIKHQQNQSPSSIFYHLSSVGDSPPSYYDGVRAIIAIQNGSVIVTGYEIDADENAAAIRRAARHNPHPHVGSDEVISALRKKLSAIENSLAQTTDSDKSVRLLHDGERIVGSHNRATG